MLALLVALFVIVLMAAAGRAARRRRLLEEEERRALEAGGGTGALAIPDADPYDADNALRLVAVARSGRPVTR